MTPTYRQRRMLQVLLRSDDVNVKPKEIRKKVGISQEDLREDLEELEVIGAVMLRRSEVKGYITRVTLTPYGRWVAMTPGIPNPTIRDYEEATGTENYDDEMGKWMS